MINKKIALINFCYKKFFLLSFFIIKNINTESDIVGSSVLGACTKKNTHEVLTSDRCCILGILLGLSARAAESYDKKGYPNYIKLALFGAWFQKKSWKKNLIDQQNDDIVYWFKFFRAKNQGKLSNYLLCKRGFLVPLIIVSVLEMVIKKKRNS